MSERPRYRVHLRRGHPIDALDVDWRPNHLRIIAPAHRLELDHDERTGHQVPNGICCPTRARASRHRWTR